MKNTAHEKITSQIVTAMENAVKYDKPWRIGGGALPHNARTGNVYNGVNTIALWAEAIGRGWELHTWATYRQWQEIGAQVQKGEQGTTTVFFKKMEIEDPDMPTGKKTVPIIRASAVFNAEQVSGYDPHYNGDAEISEQDRNAKIDSFIQSTGAKIIPGAGASYNQNRDEITLAKAKYFVSWERYYSTAFHELTHWTGHKSRCARDLTGKFRSESYAAEELVAELGAAFLCGDMGLSAEPREDHAQYLKSWIKVLKDDPKAIFAASKEATRAVQFMKNLQA